MPATASDLRQALQLHLAKLAPDAPVRGAIAAPDVEDRIAKFDAADAIALREQSAYRRLGRFGLWAMLTGAIAGALVLLPLETMVPSRTRYAIEALQGVALIVTFVAIGWISVRKSVGQWMKARALAEGMRADVFRAVMRSGVSVPELLPAALDCFKDAHLDWQLGYFRKRGRQHARAAGNLAPLRVLGYLLSALALVLAGIGLINLAAEMGFTMGALTGWARRWAITESGRWQLGLGVIGSSVLAFASARTFMDQDERNASCYASVREKLESMERDELPAAEQAARGGKAADVMAFCEKVQTILDAEHLAWSFARPPGDVRVVPRPHF
jgi:hypothetical protein